MIDLHCHIIPWIDDGAADAATACAMAIHAYRSGVDTIVATPHCNLYGRRSCWGQNYRGRSYTEVFSLFRALLRQHHIPLTVLPGAELFADPDNLRKLLDERRVVTLNHSRYLLTEFDFFSRGETISAALALIARRGYVPVVAHPERYRAVQEDPQLAVRWFRAGYVLQLNKGSLLGRLGSGAQEVSAFLLSRGLAHVIASDAHDMRYRPTGFVTLLSFLEGRCDRAYLELLLDGNPRRILADRPLIPPQ